ncbi:hypothetical protein KEM54_003069 [Ascosphaera aggregata]|nr:hypothetical protein KEM54_003069 [Ascosphaera aggregata]
MYQCYEYGHTLAWVFEETMYIAGYLECKHAWYFIAWAFQSSRNLVVASTDWPAGLWYFMQNEWRGRIDAPTRVMWVRMGHCDAEIVRTLGNRVGTMKQFQPHELGSSVAYVLLPSPDFPIE